jgi:ABC-type transporter Mla MlaB component
MSKEDLSKRLSVLQNAIDSAKDKANEADKVALDHANEQLETLKNAYETPESAEQDEYVDFEEVVDETNDKA